MFPPPSVNTKVQERVSFERRGKVERVRNAGSERRRVNKGRERENGRVKVESGDTLLSAGAILAVYGDL